LDESKPNWNHKLYVKKQVAKRKEAAGPKLGTSSQTKKGGKFRTDKGPKGERNSELEKKSVTEGVEGGKFTGRWCVAAHRLKNMGGKE